MKIVNRWYHLWPLAIILVSVCLVVACLFTRPSYAINQIPTPEPIPGSYGLAATKTQEAPTTAATIITPSNGASFTTSPITVSGMCNSELLVQVYNNSVMVGSVLCVNNSFSLQVSLFAGMNELTAIMFDDLEQAGPTSNIVNVTYTDARISAFGQLITLTSAYGRRSTPTNTELTWPLQLTGGTGPYAFSIDWGDTSKVELKSQSLAGLVTIAHTYKKAGIYQVNIQVADVNGISSFLQVIAVASGKLEETASTTSQGDGPVSPQTVGWVWIPVAVSIILLIPAFWLGRRSELVSLHHKMLKERDVYNQE